MMVEPTPLEGVLIVRLTLFSDERGFFLETYQGKRYRDAGIGDEFLQDSHSRSRRDVLRGLHFQVKRPQAQVVTLMRGRVFDVTVDLRHWSPTFGKWFGIELSEEGVRQLFMAPGFAHGFCVLSDVADLHYKVSRPYDPSDEGGVRWDDPDIGIEWPIPAPRVSARDAGYPKLCELSSDQLPHDSPVERSGQ